MIKLRFSKRYFFIPISLIVFFILFFLVYNDVKNKTINDFNKEQLITAQASSQGITTFFRNYQNELSFISKLNYIIDFNDDSKTFIANYYEHHKEFIEVVTRVDAKGKIFYTYPYNESLIGNDISYQEHVRKIIATHKPVISDVFMSVQGFLAVAMHVPVFKGNEYIGSLAILIKIDKIGKLYLEKLKIKGSGIAWLITQNGIEIFCPVEGHTGKSYLDITHNDISAIEFTEKYKNESQGTVKSVHQEVLENGQKKFIERYMAFYRVPLDNTYWTIVISYQEDEVYAELASFRDRLILIFSFIFIVLAYYFFSLTKVRTVLKEEAKRKEAEKTLLESEERYRILVETMNDGIMQVDNEDRILFVNKSICEMLGYESEELMGKIGVDTIIHEDDRDVMRMKNRIRETGISDKYEIRGVKKTGEIIWLNINGVPLTNNNGKVTGSVGFLSDITKRKYAEMELLESERLLQESQTIARLGSFVWDIKTGTWKSSKILDEIFGIDDKFERTLEGWVILIHPEWKETMKNFVLNDVLGKRIKFDKEYKIIRHFDGLECWVHGLAELEFDKNNEPVKLIGTISDVTERKKAEQEIVKLNRVYKVLSNVNQMIVRTPNTEEILKEACNIAINDGEFKVAWVGAVNKETNKLEVYTSSGLITDNFNENKIDLNDELLSGGPGGRAIKSGKHNICNDIENDESMVLWRENAKKIGYKSSAAFPIKVFGKVLYTFSLYSIDENFFDKDEIKLLDELVMDVAFALEFAEREKERKNAEKSIKESEEKYRNLIETMPEGFYRSTPDGYFVDANPALVKMFGYDSKEEIMKANIPETFYFAKEDRENIGNIAFVPETEVYRLKKKDGSEIWVEDYARYIKDAGGNVIFHEGIMRDITESLRAQKAIIEAKDKAEEASKLKSSFLANMSHEIRTPLNGILGFAELLKDELNNTELINYVEVIEKGGRRLLETLDLILNFSKLEAEMMTAHFSDVNVGNVINEVVNNFAAMAKNKNLYIKKNIIQKNLSAKIDERFLRQLLNNLVKNAIVYTDKGGLTVSLDKDEMDLVIRVKDTGIGIAKENYEMIFEPFRQESEGIGRSFEGTGLGLSITKKFVEMMKGTIDVDSEVGVGTTFTVEFPLIENDENTSAENKESKSVNKKTDIILPMKKDLTILLVENDADNLEYTLSVLRKHYKTDTAINGNESIIKAKDKAYDIILMDINLGKGIDGIMAVKEIRKLKEYKNTPIVALTAYVRDGDKEEFLEGGCTHYLGKPFSAKQLLDLIERI